MHPVMVGQWKKEILAHAGSLFEGKRGPKPHEMHESADRLYGAIGWLKRERDWLKKSPGYERGGQDGLDRAQRYGVAVGASLLVSRRSCASVYRRTIEREQREEDLLLCRLIDEETTRPPLYGSRRMMVHLKRLGHGVNHKRVERLMREMGLAGMAPVAFHLLRIQSMIDDFFLFLFLVKADL